MATTTPKDTRATVITGMRYRDARAAIDWLCRVFGFEKKAVVPDGNGGVVHAELSFGNGMVMLGSVADNPYGRLLKQPAEVGAETQAPYLVVNDADEVYARARDAGAEIVLDIVDQDYGGRGFTCRDPEGHLWSVGTYDPWEEPAG